MLPTRFQFIWPSGFREDLKKLANQKQELPVVAMFVNRSGRNSNLYIGSSIDFFKKLTNQKQELRFGDHICLRIGTKRPFFIEDLPQILPTKFRFTWLSSFRGEE